MKFCNYVWAALGALMMACSVPVAALGAVVYTQANVVEVSGGYDGLYSVSVSLSAQGASFAQRVTLLVTDAGTPPDTAHIRYIDEVPYAVPFYKEFKMRAEAGVYTLYVGGTGVSAPLALTFALPPYEPEITSGATATTAETLRRVTVWYDEAGEHAEGLRYWRTYPSEFDAATMLGSAALADGTVIWGADSDGELAWILTDPGLYTAAPIEQATVRVEFYYGGVTEPDNPFGALTHVSVSTPEQPYYGGFPGNIFDLENAEPGTLRTYSFSGMDLHLNRYLYSYPSSAGYDAAFYSRARAILVKRVTIEWEP